MKKLQKYVYFTMLLGCTAVMIGFSGCKQRIEIKTPVYHNLTLKVENNQGGLIRATINGKTCETTSEINISVQTGTDVSAKAIAAHGYRIDTWKGVSAPVEKNETAVTVTKDTLIRVSFVKDSSNSSSGTHPQQQEHTVTVSVKDNTGGSLTATADGQSLNTNQKVKHGTKVTFTARPKVGEGYETGSWAITDTAAAAGSSVVELIITKPVTVQVGFVQKQCSISFNNTPGGTLTASVNEKPIENNTKLPYGTRITFTATAQSGYTVGNWAGLTAAAGSGTGELLLKENAAVSVSFVKKTENTSPETTPQEHTVTFNTAGEGGTLTATADGKTLNTNEKAKHGTKVTFTARPNTSEGYETGVWTVVGGSAVPEGTAITEFIVTADLAVTAAFVQKQCSISFNNTTGGTLEASAAGYSNITSNTKLPYGTRITFTATAQNGYTVGNWAGLTAAAGSGTGELLLKENAAVSVSFVKTPDIPPETTPQEYTVTFNTAGAGGTLTATADGQSLTTGKTVTHGTQITFTATPDSGNGYESVGEWTVSGGSTVPAGAAVVQLIVTENLTVTAAFVKKQYVITFEAGKGGKLTAKRKNAGAEVKNGDSVPYGTIVEFTAEPEDGYSITQWSGAEPEADSNKTKAVWTAVQHRHITVNFEPKYLNYFYHDRYQPLVISAHFNKNNITGKVIIPETILGQPVKSMAGNFLSNCTEVTEVVLPKTLNSIPFSCFERCTSLKKINLETITEIQNYAFKGCTSLEKLVIPPAITQLNELIFYNCTKLEVYLPKTITKIESSAFGEYEYLNDKLVKKIYLPESDKNDNKIKTLVENTYSGSTYELMNRIAYYDDTVPPAP